jgi:hypothetical protein
MLNRIAGLLLFLPVPLVLWLFTRMPLAPGPSLALGIVLIATHRLYARPFALSRAADRCLWCGGGAEAGPEIQVAEPLGLTRWRACRESHLYPLKGTLSFAQRHGPLLRVGILGSLATFLVGSAAAAAGLADAPTLADARAVLHLGVAASVLPLGWAGPSGDDGRPEPYKVPFPMHIQALIGTRAVIWLFRLVGLAWLLLGVSHVAARSGWRA